MHDLQLAGNITENVNIVTQIEQPGYLPKNERLGSYGKRANEKRDSQGHLTLQCHAGGGIIPGRPTRSPTVKVVPLPDNFAGTQFTDCWRAECVCGLPR